MKERKKYDVRSVYRWAKHYIWCSTSHPENALEHYIRGLGAGQHGSLTARQICRLATQQPSSPAESLTDKILAGAAFLTLTALAIWGVA